MKQTTFFVTSVPRVSRSSKVEEAAKAMHLSGADDMLVVDPTDCKVPVGRITASDIALGVIGRGLAPADVPVANVMRPLSVVAREEEPLSSTLRRMAEAGLHHAPVVDRNGHLAGIITIEEAGPEGICEGGPLFAAPSKPILALAEPPGDDQKPAPVVGKRISQREYQVMQWMLTGRTLKQMARDLSISPNTVSTYRGRLLKKLGLRSNSDLFRTLLAAGGLAPMPSRET
jgi:DNA-binding CsgD family transcriptional regulator/CBS domain-containing protein